MIMLMLSRPLEKLGLLSMQHSDSAMCIFIWIRPWVVVKIIVEFAINPSQGYTAVFRPKTAMIDVGGTPKITSRWQLSKLHHRAITIDMVSLFCAIVIRNIVLHERGYSRV